MPRGSSGRIVIEVDTTLKQNLYIYLAKRNMTLKDWFIDAATTFLDDSTAGQLPLHFAAETSTEYSTKSEDK